MPLVADRKQNCQERHYSVWWENRSTPNFAVILAAAMRDVIPHRYFQAEACWIAHRTQRRFESNQSLRRGDLWQSSEAFCDRASVRNAVIFEGSVPKTLNLNWPLAVVILKAQSDGDKLRELHRNIGVNSVPKRLDSTFVKGYSRSTENNEQNSVLNWH